MIVVPCALDSGNTCTGTVHYYNEKVYLFIYEIPHYGVGFKP